MRMCNFRGARVFVLGAALGFMMLGTGCSANSSIVNSRTEEPAPGNENVRSEFEKDVEKMQTADFEYIFVFRRKDGGALDKDDKSFLRNNMPAEINRIYVSDEGKALIAGSHFPFPPDNLRALKARFDFEDLSNATKTPGNNNVNTNR